MTVLALMTATAFGLRPLLLAGLAAFTVVALVVWRKEDQQ